MTWGCEAPRDSVPEFLRESLRLAGKADHVLISWGYYEGKNNVTLAWEKQPRVAAVDTKRRA